VNLKLSNLTLFTNEELLKLTKEELVNLVQEVNGLAHKYYNQANQNSTNSSQPPSTDNIKTKLEKSDRRKHKSRIKSTKKSGGQLGHKGDYLKPQTPDEINKIYYYNPFSKPGTILKTCQQIDIRTSKKVVEYQLISTLTQTPETINSKLPNYNTVYSDNVKAWVAYLSVEHAISEDRISRLFKDLFGIDLSIGSVNNFLTKSEILINPIYTKILQALQSQEILGSDETFLSLNGKLGLLWNWNCPRYSYFYASDSRKYQNVTDTIPDFKGVLISDRYGAQLKLGCKHQLCTVHIIRNLKALPDSKTKFDLIELFYQAQKADTNQENYNFFLSQMLELFQAAPLQEPYLKKLIKSLTKHQEKVFQFLLNPKIKHHNNDTERELRKSKIKSKISGCFRTLNGFQIYAKLLTFIQTCKKQGQNVLTELQNLFSGKVVNLSYC
jgi:transposase